MSTMTLWATARGNNRNGTSAKTVLTDAGAVPLKVPRDRNGEFEPKLVPKHARRLEVFNDIVLSLVSRGMTTRDVRAHLAAAYQVDISAELISKITDVVLPELRAWQARPLDAMYPVLYLDAIVVKVRTDGRVTNRPVYIAMAIDLDGCKHVLGLSLARQRRRRSQILARGPHRAPQPRGARRADRML